MGGGPSQQTQAAEQNLATTQTQVFQNYIDLANKQFSRATTLEQPSVDFYTSIINAAKTGDYSKLLSAAGPVVSNITQQAQGTEANIMNTVAPGAARDYALASTQRQTGTDIASTINQIYMGAFPALASLGGEANQVGLGVSSAGISAGNSAGSTLGQLGNQQAQGKSSVLGLFGNIASAAGTAASGGFFNSGGGSTTGVTPYYATANAGVSPVDF